MNARPPPAEGEEKFSGNAASPRKAPDSLVIIRRPPPEEAALPVIPARLPAAAVLLAGAVLVPPAPASAGSCVTDDWKLTRYRMKAVGQDVEIKAEGAEGTRLRIARKSLSYDFARAGKVRTSGDDNGDRYTMTSVYKKKIAFDSTLKGARKGTLEIKRRTGEGDATVKSVFNTISLRTVRLARYYRDGNVDPLIPVRQTFTCSGGTLKITATLPDPAAPAAVTATYRRL